MTEEEKHNDTSIWLCVNNSPIKTGNSCTIRRCNTALAMVGSPTNDYNNTTEIHYEPCVLDNEMRYMQVYYNQTIPIPQAEWYATMQCNYYSNKIKINDRFLFGTIDEYDRDNNSAYKVKAVIKGNTNHTFVKDNVDELVNTELVIIALDKDLISPDDNLKTRVACNAPLYLTKSQTQYNQYYISTDVEEFAPYIDSIIMGEVQGYGYGLFLNKELIEDFKEFNVTWKLNGIIEDNWGNYFQISPDGEEYVDIRSGSFTSDSFYIKNIKKCTKGKLDVTVSCTPEDGDTEISKIFSIQLGGFY